MTPSIKVKLKLQESQTKNYRVTTNLIFNNNKNHQKFELYLLLQELSYLPNKSYILQKIERTDPKYRETLTLTSARKIK